MKSLDRDALEELLWDWRASVIEAGGAHGTETVFAVANRICALLQPTGGFVITGEECEVAADWHDYIVDHDGEMPTAETEIALRLRAAAAAS